MCVLSREGASSRFALRFLSPRLIHIAFVLSLFPLRSLYLVLHLQPLQLYIYFIKNMARFCFFTQFLLLSFAAFLLASDSRLIKGKLFVSEVGGAPHLDQVLEHLCVLF